ncbi:MAG TPA: hypothetical protein VFJ47_10880, partial [Terriglobales bacterium]|nr:hypothetical protein [Terriglobales bacterium]
DARDSALLSALRNVTRAKYRHAVQVVAEMRASLFPKASDGGVKMPSRTSSSSTEPVLRQAAIA